MCANVPRQVRLAERFGKRALNPWKGEYLHARQVAQSGPVGALHPDCGASGATRSQCVGRSPKRNARRRRNCFNRHRCCVGPTCLPRYGRCRTRYRMHSARGLLARMCSGSSGCRQACRCRVRPRAIHASRIGRRRPRHCASVMAGAWIACVNGRKLCRCACHPDAAVDQTARFGWLCRIC